MLITKDNYEENKLYVTEFIKVIRFITNHERFTLFGGVVRDLIIPLSNTKTGNFSLRSFEEVLDSEPIYINDIDVIFFGKEDSFSANVTIFEQVLETHDWKLEKEYIENEVDIYEINPYANVKKHMYRNLVTDMTIDIDLVNVPSRNKVIIDFNVNDVMWNIKHKFEFITISDFEEYSHELYSHENIYYKKLENVMRNIKEKKCSLLDRFIINGENKMKRIIKMKDKGFHIMNCKLNVFNSYENVDIDDRKCLICLGSLSKGNDSISICGYKHLIHEKCGEIWYKKKTYRCLICRDNGLIL